MGSDETHNKLASAAGALKSELSALYEALQDSGPRDNEDYYPTLLRAYELTVANGDKSPNQTLGRLLAVSPETIRTQLKKARKQAEGR
ncbi:hypothetical protein [Marmoricola sp. RAF53]|uniref:hypothetical protein n=1 Tax=Marmoricola sp. RAF53 TaxID=3233059 RepID=UPI003F9C8D06